MRISLRFVESPNFSFISLQISIDQGLAGLSWGYWAGDNVPRQNLTFFKFRLFKIPAKSKCMDPSNIGVRSLCIFQGKGIKMSITFSCPLASYQTF